MTAYENKTMKVGIFVFAGLVLVIIAILISGGSRSLFVKNVQIHARFENVQGLNVGSSVSLAGVNIGNISEINFLPEVNTLDVEMSINASFLERITIGSSVEIRTQGALGDKFVYIIPGDPKNPPISLNTILEANKATDLLGILTERSAEVGKIFDVIDETHKLMKSINDSNRVQQIIANMLEASSLMSKTSLEAHRMLAETSPKLRDSADKLDHILRKIDSGEGTLGALINDPSIHDQLKNFLGGNTQKKNIKSLLRNSIEKSGN